MQTFDAPRDPGWDVLHPMFPVGYFDRWLEHAEGRAILYDMHAALFGPLDLAVWGYGEEHLSLKPALVVAFERGDLVALVPRRRNAELPGRPEVPIEPPRRPQPRPPVKTFIEIVLLDDDRNPVPGEAFELTLPDGDVRQGTLDQAGFARVDGIDPGTCDVSFPKIDGREWGTRPVVRIATDG